MYVLRQDLMKATAQHSVQAKAAREMVAAMCQALFNTTKEYLHLHGGSWDDLMICLQ